MIPCQTAAALCPFHNLSVMLIPGFANYLASDAAHQTSLGWGKFDSYMTAGTGWGPYQSEAPFERILNWGLTNITTWDLPDGLRLKNIIGYRRLLQDIFEDIDGTSTGVSSLAGLHNLPLPILSSNNVVNFQQFSEELQLQGTALDNKANWVTGVFLSRYSGTDGADAVQFGQRFFNPFDTTAKSLGLYGQVDVKMSDKITLTGGYRYSWDYRTGTYHSIEGSPFNDTTVGFFGQYGQNIVLPTITNPTAQCDFNRTATATHAAFAGVDPTTCAVHASLHGNAPSYNLTLQYKPTDDVMVYLAHRQGYRAGFLSARATSYEGMVNQNETVRDLELGVKSDWHVADMPVRLNAATYYSWYSNIAVSVPKIDPATGLAVNEAENSGAARLYGWEATFDIRPIEALTLSATYAYTQAVYDSFPSQTVTDALGNPLIFYSNEGLQFGFPRDTFTLTGSYNLPVPESVGQITASANYYHSSKRPDNPPIGSGKGFNTFPPYGLLNLRVDWHNVMGRPIDLSAFVNNLANTHYWNSSFAFEDAAGFRSAFPGDPRLFGVILSYRFGAEAKQ